MQKIRKIATLRTAEMFREHLAALGLDLPFEDALQGGAESPLAQPLEVDGLTLTNRWCILPMEGWDGTPDGRPSENTLRRWRRFGQSGAGLVWGGEAVAVRPDGRANPNQLMINPSTLPELVRLREALLEGYREAQGEQSRPVIGLQLTHSGRYARPNQKQRPEPRIAYDHPILNPRVGLPARSEPGAAWLVSDDQLDELVATFVEAAALAQEAGFDFVDVKLCHGYLGHELLSAVERPGRYGGSLENRTRFAREMVEGIRQRAPGLKLGSRISIFDFIPFRMGPDGVGEPDWGPFAGGRYPFAFGGDGSGLGIDLSEPIALVQMLNRLGVALICATAGSPYWVPHIQRPAYFPPSDGYQPPEDPLVGVARQVAAVRDLKAACPGAVLVGSAYSALQDWLPNVAQAVLRQGGADLVGLGRMVLAYPELPADVLAGRTLDRKRICRTFSDCTTAPRNGLVSGCYPIDEHYKNSPESEMLGQIKRAAAEK